MAELKLFKFGELSACKDGDNPERSLVLIEERVETRRRVCKKCGKQISDKKHSNSIFCSVRCKNAFNTQKYRIKHKLIKKPGVGSGHNQGYHETHATWKTGIGTFRKIAFEHYEPICNRCGSIENLCVPI